VDLDPDPQHWLFRSRMADFLSILIKLSCENEGEKEKENNKRKENFLLTRALLNLLRKDLGCS
jgi:hypothetical protein